MCMCLCVFMYVSDVMADLRRTYTAGGGRMTSGMYGRIQSLCQHGRPVIKISPPHYVRNTQRDHRTDNIEIIII